VGSWRCQPPLVTGALNDASESVTGTPLIPPRPLHIMLSLVTNEDDRRNRRLAGMHCAGIMSVGLHDLDPGTAIDLHRCPVCHTALKFQGHCVIQHQPFLIGYKICMQVFMHGQARNW
jgi:hypothetical protein